MGPGGAAVDCAPWAVPASAAAQVWRRRFGEKGLADAPFSSDSLTRKPLTVHLCVFGFQVRGRTVGAHCMPVVIGSHTIFFS